MNKRFLRTVTTTALLLGSSIALAQSGGGGNGGAGGGQDNQLLNMQQRGSGGNDSGACPTPDQCPQGASRQHQMQGGQAQQGVQQNETQGQASQQPTQGQNTKQAKRKPVQGEEQNEAQDQNSGTNTQSQARAKNQNNANEPATTGSTNAKVDITDKQRTEIRTSIREEHIKPVAHVDFDINIGVAVPNTIVLHPLPARIVEIVPAYEGYEFFMLADGTIVIVEPATLKIVYVLA